MFERIAYKELNLYLKQKLIIVITGMRRVGKTTAVKYLLDQVRHNNKRYFDMEHVQARALFRNVAAGDEKAVLISEGIDLTKPCVIAIDEIQLLPEITSLMKYLYDNYKVKFIVTGSSSFYIKSRFNESLAGRKHIVELHPLSFIEFLNFRRQETKPVLFNAMKKMNTHHLNRYEKLYDEFLKFGGFPEVVLASNKKIKTDYLNDILNSYIDYDTRLLSDFELGDDLYRLITLLSGRVGSRVDFSQLGSFTGINRNKIKQYMILLEETYFIKHISPFTRNADSEIKLLQKFYFSDTGILNLFKKVSSGQLFENAIAIQLSLQGKLNYYQKKSGEEIDFVLNEKTAIEVKETPYLQDLEKLRSRSKTLNLKTNLLIGKYQPGNGFNEFVWGGNVV